MVRGVWELMGNGLGFVDGFGEKVGDEDRLAFLKVGIWIMWVGFGKKNLSSSDAQSFRIVLGFKIVVISTRREKQAEDASKLFP